MYRFCFFLLCAVACASCGKKYKIDGVSSVASLDGKMLFIKVLSGDSLVNIDSAEVVHGLFKMTGEVDSAVIASLYMDDDCIMPLVIEQGKIDINIDNAGFTVKGTPLNDCFNDFIMKHNSLTDRAYEVERLEARMIMDGKDPQAIRSEVDRQRGELACEMDSLAKAFIQANYGNVLGPGVFIMLCEGLPYPLMTPVMEEIVDSAPHSFRENPAVKAYVAAARSNMDKLQAVQ